MDIAATLRGVDEKVGDGRKLCFLCVPADIWLAPSRGTHGSWCLVAESCKTRLVCFLWG